MPKYHIVPNNGKYIVQEDGDSDEGHYIPESFDAATGASWHAANQDGPTGHFSGSYAECQAWIDKH